MQYAVNAVIYSVETTNGADYHSTHHSPTFYLDSRVQGIVDAEHAKVIALDVIDMDCSMRNDPNKSFLIYASEI